MAKNEANARIYGDKASGVWVADKGTTGPTDLSTPAGFVELGWLSEDGISFDREEDATSHRAYQGATLIRRKTNSVEDSFTFQCLEETADVLGLYYKGATPSVSAGVATISVTDQAKQDDRAFVVDVVDDTVTKRYVIASASVSGGSIAHSNSELTVYEFTATIQGDYKILTNATAVAGSGGEGEGE